jgi:hypothetical protein
MDGNLSCVNAIGPGIAAAHPSGIAITETFGIAIARGITLTDGIGIARGIAMADGIAITREITLADRIAIAAPDGTDTAC